MKRLVPVFVCVLGAVVSIGCSSANDSVSDTSNGSVVGTYGVNLVITAEQAATLIGKTEVVAEAYAHDNGWVWRVGRRDSEEFAVTMDYCECRVTVSIDKTIVTAVVVG